MENLCGGCMAFSLKLALLLSSKTQAYGYIANPDNKTDE